MQDVLDYLHGKGLKVSIRTLKRKSQDGTLYKLDEEDLQNLGASDKPFWTL